MRSLRVAAPIEFVSLLVLLVNLATVDWHPVASLVGPIHGCAYLFVAVVTLRAPGAVGWTRLSGLVPGVGGLIAIRRLSAAGSPR